MWDLILSVPDHFKLYYSVTLKLWVTLEFSRRHGNLKPKRFDVCIEYKLIDRTCPFHYQ